MTAASKQTSKVAGSIGQAVLQGQFAQRVSWSENQRPLTHPTIMRDAPGIMSSTCARPAQSHLKESRWE